MTTRKKYSKEFKLDAISLVLEQVKKGQMIMADERIRSSAEQFYALRLIPSTDSPSAPIEN